MTFFIDVLYSVCTYSQTDINFFDSNTTSDKLKKGEIHVIRLIAILQMV